MNKKILLTLILGMFLISFVSAVKIDYSPNEKGIEDMKVHVIDTTLFGLIDIGELGTMELKSHKNPTDIKTVGIGWQVTMIYETNFGEAYKGALGDVTFIDMKTGKEIEKEYKIVYLNGEIKERNVCVKYDSPDLNSLENTKMTNEEIADYIMNYEGKCLEYEEETYADGEWIEYNSKDIPKGKIVLGLMVNNELGEKIDGIWEVQGKKIEKHAEWSVIETLTDAGSAILELSLNNDDSLLATGSYDYNVYIYDTSNWNLIQNLTDSTNGIDYVAFSNDGSRLVSSSKDGNIYVYDTSTWTLSETLSRGGSSLSFSPDDSLLVSGSSVYDTSTWTVTETIYGSRQAKFNFEGSLLVSDIYVYNTSTWNLIENLTTTAEVTDLSFNPDDSLLAKTEFTSGGNETQIYNTSTWNSIQNFSFGEFGRSLEFSHDGKTLVLGSYSGNIRFLDTSTWNVTQTLSPGGQIHCLEFFSDDSKLAIARESQVYIAKFPKITFEIFSPDESSTTNSIDFKFNLNDDNLGVQNVSLLINGSIVQTNTSGLSGNYTFTETLSNGIYTWKIQSYDNSSNIYESSEYNLEVDSTHPTINLTSPSGTYDYLYENKSLDVNWAVFDTGENLDTCWIEYNGINNTVTCNDNYTTINYSLEINNLTFYANDSLGNLNSSSISWNYKVLQNSIDYNTTTYETAYETYSTNITANNSLTSVYLLLNGTEYLTTQNGNIWSKSLDIPTSKVGNNSIRWKFVYDENNIYSDISYQTINSAIWNICNGTYTDDFLNISFIDEGTLNYINASITSSTFEYYLGTGSVKKTYNYLNPTEHYTYEFCASPTDKTFKVEPYVQYKNGVDYPQRIWDSGVLNFNNSVTSKELYLLSSLDGIYVTFQVIDSVEKGIEGVEVKGTREISGEDFLVANGITGAGGGVTFWLNPDFQHNFTFSKTGYSDYSILLTPTQTTYTVSLGGEAIENPDYVSGISYTIKPTDSFLENNNTYNFIYTISSTESNLDEYGFTLLVDDSIVSTQSDTSPTGSSLNFNYDVTDSSRIVMQYYYEINETTISGERYWDIYSQNSFSISYLFGEVGDAINENVLGINGNDEGAFSRAFICVLILILVSGTLSYKYGLGSEQAISGIIFGLLLILNSINLLPSPTGFPNLNNVILVVSGLWILISILKEEFR